MTPTPSTSPPRPVRAERVERLFAALSALAMLSVLALAAWLQPADRGHGTHEQLGLQPCTWVSLLNSPCPTCGMTTAFAHAARADFASSFVAQPLGCLLALGAATTFWFSLHVAITGSTIGRALANLLGRRLLWLALAALLGAWGYKIATWPGL